MGKNEGSSDSMRGFFLDAKANHLSFQVYCSKLHPAKPPKSLELDHHLCFSRYEAG
ncbi:hypothetical protein COLO4_05968 [Corchorus olitorius]|uniref:Uncharacterized protein n=1 Tax=Corchorus olitorius TaxID=93759 RepID=A0A1R3KPJ5_9ROSI|nr:hypothetical protein COLO4_05968 [Corchorus olitorius]